MTFGKRLAELRNSKMKDDGTRAWSQDDLAVASGIPAGTVRAHEQGRREPSLRHLYGYCEALGVSCEKFKNCQYRVKSKPKPVAKPKKRK